MTADTIIATNEAEILLASWTVCPPLMMHNLGMTPDPWQADVLRSRHERMLMLTTRQAGKSTTTAIKALHVAVTEPGSLILMFSPSLRQSGELFRKAARFYRDLGEPVPALQATQTMLELSNGSRIVSLPGSQDTVRGYSAPRLIIADEAAQIDDGLFIAIAPMLATSTCGQLILISTPFGKRGFYFDQWEQAGGPWQRYQVTAYDCPRISREFLEEQKRTLGERWYRQEYMCSFEETIDQCFPTEAINRAFDNDVPLLFSTESS